MRAIDYIEQSNSCKSTEEAFDLFCQAVADHGYDRVAFAALGEHRRFRSQSKNKPIVKITYPTEWVDHYLKEDFQSIDPVFHYAPYAERPFQWGMLEQSLNLTPRQRLIMDEGRSAGLNHGISVPLHGAWGDCALVSLASSQSPAEQPSARPSELQLLAAQFLITAQELQPEPVAVEGDVHLTARERECLYWSANGKSSWDISVILGISENTVNFHFKRIVHKLGTNSRIVAIIKAIRMNMIFP